MTVKKVLVIEGSARENGNTVKAVEKLCPYDEYETVSLIRNKIYPYRYDGKYPSDDDFLTIARKMQRVQVIIFATPVYWFSMSGLMKVFFDRFSDLISSHKEIGRGLKGKKVYLIAQGYSKSLPEGFEAPFRSTSEYLEMEFKETLYMSFES
jgi:multimeric flavodoxin WrbA